MKTFLKNLLIFFSFPVLISAIIVGLYLKQDVYADLGNYKNYSWKYTFQQLGDLSTKKILQSPGKYNSFIFGSSRSVSVYACYVQQKIKDSKFFHYANWNEPIGGIYAKLKLLDSLQYDLDNVIIYLDTDYTFDEDGKCRNDHYLLTGKSKFNYYNDHFRDFVFSMEADKMKILFGLDATGEIFPNWHSDTLTNDSQHICTDSMLHSYAVYDITKKDSVLIDSLKETGFLYKREVTQKFKASQISLSEKDMLVKIKQLLEKKHSNKYYIVITPLYDQLKFNKTDHAILSSVFEGHLYDFSGINNITNNPYNYPDKKHFRPYNSKQMLDSIIDSK